MIDQKCTYVGVVVVLEIDRESNILWIPVNEAWSAHYPVSVLVMK